VRACVYVCVLFSSLFAGCTIETCEENRNLKRYNYRKHVGIHSPFTHMKSWDS